MWRSPCDLPYEVLYWHRNVLSSLATVQLKWHIKSRPFSDEMIGHHWPVNVKLLYMTSGGLHIIPVTYRVDPGLCVAPRGRMQDVLLQRWLVYKNMMLIFCCYKGLGHRLACFAGTIAILYLLHFHYYYTSEQFLQLSNLLCVSIPNQDFCLLTMNISMFVYIQRLKTDRTDQILLTAENLLLVYPV